MFGSLTPTLGTFQALAAAVLFGLTAPLAKQHLMDLPPIQASGLLYLGAGLSLGFLSLIGKLRSPRGERREAALQRTDLPYLGGSILLGGLLGPVLLMYGLARCSGTMASLLLNLEAVATVFLAMAFGESLDRRTFLGAGVIVLGGLLLSIDPSQWGQTSLFGTLAIAGACVSWGLDNNLTQKLSGKSPQDIVAIKGLVAGAIALGIAALMGAHLPPLGTLGAATVLGAGGYGLSLLLFVLALRHIGTARTGSLFATGPFVGALASVLLLHEGLSWLTVAAGVAMGIGVWIMVSEEHAHEHEHEELAHDHAHTHDEHHPHDHGGDVGPEPHAHPHVHLPMTHAHPHRPDLHHRHSH